VFFFFFFKEFKNDLLLYFLSGVKEREDSHTHTGAFINEARRFFFKIEINDRTSFGISSLVASRIFVVIESISALSNKINNERISIWKAEAFSIFYKEAARISLAGAVAVGAYSEEFLRWDFDADFFRSVFLDIFVFISFSVCFLFFSVSFLLYCLINWSVNWFWFWFWLVLGFWLRFFFWLLLVMFFFVLWFMFFVLWFVFWFVFWFMLWFVAWSSIASVIRIIIFIILIVFIVLHVMRFFVMFFMMRFFFVLVLYLFLVYSDLFNFYFWSLNLWRIFFFGATLSAQIAIAMNATKINATYNNLDAILYSLFL